ncbi:SufD family Fe-S cluster assembly protein [Companilactobacillus sp.]|uniref:SufD family Fe-S cluster assembly protein n=1 Tax=Companilactobacillus sp. TaxID=2767905 RepID=UPI00260A673D|nr:SufD family Fe-S cluster assembly protein [Companilactobacillus sp.]
MTNEITTELETFGNKHGEPHWFVQRRLDALAKIAKAPVTSIPNYPFEKNKTAVDQAPEKIKLTKELLAMASVDESEIGLTQIGQSSLENTLDEDDEDAGVILTDIFTAFRQHPQLIQKYFASKVIDESTSQDTAANTAFLNNGIFLYLPKNYQLNDSVILNIIQDNVNQQPLYSHVFIYADEGSSVNTTLDIRSIGDVKNYANVVVEVLARPNSKVDISVLSEISTEENVVLNTGAQISRDAQVNWNIAEVNQGPTDANFHTTLSHKTAKTQLQVLTWQNEDYPVAINSQINAKVEQTTDIVEQFGFCENSEKFFMSSLINYGKDKPTGEQSLTHNHDAFMKHTKIISKRSHSTSLQLDPDMIYSLVVSSLIGFNRTDLLRQYSKSLIRRHGAISKSKLVIKKSSLE